MRHVGCEVAATGQVQWTAMSRPQAHFGVSAKRLVVRPWPAGGGGWTGSTIRVGP